MPQYCLITHTIHSVAIDGPDTDRDPDHHPVTGMVIFEPLLGKGDSVVVTTNGQPTTIVLTPIEARITNGEIYHRGEKGIKLFAGGPDTNPNTIRYKATFHNLIAGGKPLTLKEIIFETIPGGTIHLPKAQPVPGAPYPGYSVQMEQALTEIETARTTALANVNTAVTTAVTAQMGTKADKTTVEQLTAQVMATMGMAGSALRLGTAIQQVRDEALAAVESARLATLAEAQAAVTTAVTAQMGAKADKTVVEQLTGQVMATMGMAGSALSRTKN